MTAAAPPQLGSSPSCNGMRGNMDPHMPQRRPAKQARRTAPRDHQPRPPRQKAGFSNQPQHHTCCDTTVRQPAENSVCRRTANTGHWPDRQPPFGHFSNEVSGERIRIAFGQIDHIGPVRNRGSHFAIHIGEHIRRNRLRHRSERNRRNIRSHSSTLPIIVRLYMRTFTHIRNHQCVTLRANQSPIH